MKNVTITLSEDVTRWARVWAAQHDTSMSRMLGEILQDRMIEENSYEKAMEAFLNRRPTALKRKGGYPRRDELYDRTLLR